MKGLVSGAKRSREGEVRVLYPNPNWVIILVVEDDDDEWSN